MITKLKFFIIFLFVMLLIPSVYAQSQTACLVVRQHSITWKDGTSTGSLLQSDKVSYKEIVYLHKDSHHEIVLIKYESDNELFSSVYSWKPQEHSIKAFDLDDLDYKGETKNYLLFTGEKQTPVQSIEGIWALSKKSGCVSNYHSKLSVNNIKIISDDKITVQGVTTDGQKKEFTITLGCLSPKLHPR